MSFLLPLTLGLMLSCSAEWMGPQQKQPPLVVQGQLTRSDFLDLKDKTHFKAHAIPLKVGMSYRIDLASRQFNPYLRLRDPMGQEIAVQGDRTHAQVLVKAARNGLYQVLVTTGKARQMGAYVLTVTKLDSADFASARLAVRIKKIGSSTPLQRRQIVNDLKKHLGSLGPKLKKADLELARQAAQSLELVARDLPLAAQAYANFAALAAASADAEVARSARLLEGAARRLKLTNQPLRINGVSVTGQAVDLRAFRGKVVLVSFVDTTNPASVAEWRDNLRFLYSLYKDHGFAVLGVGLNKDRQSLEQLLKAESIPWPCLHDVPAGAGGPGPLAEHLGIAADALPLGILVERSGKVVSPTVRRADLAILLPGYVAQANALPGPGPRGQPFPQVPGRGFPQNPGQFSPPGPVRVWGLGPWIGILIAVVLVFLILLPFALILASQAKKRGYRGGTWFLTGLLSFNPMFPLVVLALLPHRARQARRLKELQALQEKLAEARAPVAAKVQGAPRPEASPPAVPSAAASTASFPSQSVGDQATRDFPAASLGDEITRV